MLCDCHRSTYWDVVTRGQSDAQSDLNFWIQAVCHLRTDHTSKCALTARRHIRHDILRWPADSGALYSLNKSHINKEKQYRVYINIYIDSQRIMIDGALLLRYCAAIASVYVHCAMFCHVKCVTIYRNEALEWMTSVRFADVICRLWTEWQSHRVSPRTVFVMPPCFKKI